MSNTRRTKDYVEIVNLALAAASADEVAHLIQSGEIKLAGRSERAVSDNISRALIDFGHQKINFAIVGSGPNSASPHHDPTERTIQSGDAVVCDFGGSYSVNDEPGYCSDTTRTFFIGKPDQRFREAFSVLLESQETSRVAAKAGVGLSEIDGISRSIIEEGGFGEYFIHRLGHGIGLEEHEEPYLSQTAKGSLKEFDCFSIEPGIYLPGKYGARIEDIVVAFEDQSVSLNTSPRELVIFD